MEATFWIKTMRRFMQNYIIQPHLFGAYKSIYHISSVFMVMSNMVEYTRIFYWTEPLHTSILYWRVFTKETQHKTHMMTSWRGNALILMTHSGVNPMVPHHHRPVMWNFEVCFVAGFNKLLTKHLRYRWFKTHDAHVNIRVHTFCFYSSAFCHK